MKLLFFALALFLSISSLGSTCPLKERFQKELSSHLQLTTEDKNKNTNSIDLCDKNNLAQKTVEAIFFLKDLPILNSEEDDFNKNTFKGSPYDYFKSKVKVLIFDIKNKTPDCQKEASAYVAAGADLSLGQIYICPTMQKMDRGFEIASILVHEAKHLEGPHVTHQFCSFGEYKGRFACDKSYGEDGSYTIQTEFAVKVWRTKSLPISIRRQARKFAISSFISRFNREPLDLQRGHLLRNESNQLYFLNQFDELKKLPFATPNLSTISIKGPFAQFMFKDSPKVKAYSYSQKLTESPTNALNRLFATLTSNERSQVKDTLFASKYACILLSNELICLDPKYKVFRKKIPHFVASHFIQQKGSGGPLSGSGSVKISDSKGFWYRLPNDIKNLKTLQPEEWDRTPQSRGLKTIVRLPYGNLLGLSVDGELVKFSRQTRESTEIKSEKLLKFLQLKTPFTWSQKLSEL